jgi:Uma2 family endonuclease
MQTVILRTDALNMTEEEFFNFCQENDTLRLGRNSNGEILWMEPTGIYISNLNLKIASRIEIWNEKSGLGYAFDSNAGFTLPDKSVRSPDASWIKKERYEALPEEDRDRFGHICPDFVMELKSKADSLTQLKRMLEWTANGCLLAWLINPEEQNVYIFRKDGSIELKSFEETISGEDVLPGFELDLSFMKPS